MSDAAPLGRFYARAIDGPPSRKEMPVRVPRLLLMFSLALAACSGEPAGAAGDVQVSVTEVRTDPWISGPDVIFKVRNERTTAVYLERCGERILASVDRWTGAGWEPFVNDYCPLAAVFPPLKLEPGEEADGAQVVHLAGAYRIRPRIYSLPFGPQQQPRWIEAEGRFVIPE